MQWFWAAYLMTTDTRGVSALLLQRQLGLRRYETAWLMLHKLRRAMVNAAREPLHGAVEVDDTWIGGQQPGLRGSRQLKGRRAALVLVAVEKRGHGSGRVRLAVIPDVKAATLTAFLTQNVAPGSTVYTDGPEELHGLGRRGTPAHPTDPTPAHRAPSRSHVGGTARRPRHWQPAAMVDRHLSWRQPGTAPGLSGRVRLSTQSPSDTDGGLSDPARPRYDACTHSAAPHPRWPGSVEAARRGCVTTTSGSQLKQPDKQKTFKVKTITRRPLQRLHEGGSWAMIATIKGGRNHGSISHRATNRRCRRVPAGCGGARRRPGPGRRCGVRLGARASRRWAAEHQRHVAQHPRHLHPPRVAGGTGGSGPLGRGAASQGRGKWPGAYRGGRMEGVREQWRGGRVWLPLVRLVLRHGEGHRPAGADRGSRPPAASRLIRRTPESRSR